MSGHILRIYAMTVCFFSLMCGAIALGMGIFNVVKLSVPSATIHPATVQHLQSLEEFRQSRFTASGPMFIREGVIPVQPALRTAPSSESSGEMLSDESLEELRQAQLAQAYANHRFRARQGLIQQSITVFICAVLFLLHWRLARVKPVDNAST